MLQLTVGRISLFKNKIYMSNILEKKNIKEISGNLPVSMCYKALKKTLSPRSTVYG